MVSYEGYGRTVEIIQKTVVEKMLKPIAFQQYENDKGHGIEEVLPGNHDKYEFESRGLEADVDPERHAFENPMYDDRILAAGSLAANPDAYAGLVDDLYESWWEAFGEWREMASQPNHPGEPPLNRDDLKQTFSDLCDKHELLCADPQLDDLVGAVRDKNYRLAARFLNVDDPLVLFNPGGGHELTALFTNGAVHVVYRDRDIAVLKPEYNHEQWVEVLSQRRPPGQRVTISGEVPEEAFVVGVDDTPTGLFAHSIDGTRLTTEQSITRDYLHDVMGFDRNYRHEDNLTISTGERVRLQGDLAIEKVDSNVPGDATEAGRCNVPIDNHLGMLTDALLPADESLDEEPIRVIVPEETTLNVVHDEHEQVVTQVEKGVYEFSLLPRGLQPREDRPDWPDVEETSDVNTLSISTERV